MSEHLRNSFYKANINLIQNHDLIVCVSQVSPRPTVPSMGQDDWTSISSYFCICSGFRVWLYHLEFKGRLKQVSLTHTACVTLGKLFNLSEPQFFIEKQAWYLPCWVSGIRKGKAYREPHTEHKSQRTCYEAGLSAKKVRIINSLDGKYKISSLAHIYEI